MKATPRACVIFIALICLSGWINAQNYNRPLIDTLQYKIIRVKPSATDPAIHNFDTAHVIYFNPGIKTNKLLLWLTGTNGTTNNIPVEFFITALGQGYRIIALSYISVPAVSQICVGDALQLNTDCAAAFRRKRIYGDNNFTLIADKPQDAIIPRFTKLLQWLVNNDAAGNWSQYFNGEMLQPVWNRIAIAGQSQGGGMAQFIGQHELTDRVISFSGGWDYANSKTKTIAGWYYNKPVTPVEKWYATYNTQEMAATVLAQICTALQLAATHVFALDQPLLNKNIPGANPYHGDGLRNPAYKDIWIKMLGSGLQ